MVIEPTSFSDELARSPVNFVGDGARKCRSAISHENADFNVSVNASARWMAKPAQQLFDSEQFEDMAYFVPFYLKAYQTGKKIE